MTITSARKQKTFPALDAPESESLLKRQVIKLDSEESGDDSDAPEAVTLTGGRAVADAKSSAIKAHQTRLLEKRKAQNKSREAFIQSSKSKSSSGAPEPREARVSEDGGNELNGAEAEENPNDTAEESAFLARMTKAMQDAQNEAQGEDEDMSGNVSDILASSTRLPDSIFAAAAVAHQETERKRKPSIKKLGAAGKRRRVREGGSERVVGGRAVRVLAALDAPPPPPSTATRKVNKGTKGGAAFRRKWNKRDALQAQIRSRNGPAKNFATMAR